MGKLTVLVCVLGVVAVCTAEWALVWEDQFDGGDLWERWNFENSCNGKSNYLENKLFF